jgi:hypothetical protein
MESVYSMDPKNSLAKWMASDAWTRIPGFMNVRGECVERYISSKTGAKICKIVANGTISGTIDNAR